MESDKDTQMKVQSPSESLRRSKHVRHESRRDSLPQSQLRAEETVEVISTFLNRVGKFDSNTDNKQNLKFVVAGLPEPLKLHCGILREASEYLKKKIKSDKVEMKLVWEFDTSSEVDREAIVTALRFCYGESMCLGTQNGECLAVLAALKRLQVTNLGRVTEQVEDFMCRCALKNVATGIALLKACTRYSEHCGEEKTALDQKLATIVLTMQNITEHYPEVVDDCLMALPHKYLDYVEYGAPHTRCSEFSLRLVYVKFHKKDLAQEEKQAIITKCDLRALNGLEFSELRHADALDNDTLLDAHESALTRHEVRAEEDARRAAQLEEQRDEFRRRARNAEEALEEQKRRFRLFSQHKHAFIDESASLFCITRFCGHITEDMTMAL